jgi:hypothetical protein
MNGNSFVHSSWTRFNLKDDYGCERDRYGCFSVSKGWRYILDRPLTYQMLRRRGIPLFNHFDIMILFSTYI